MSNILSESQLTLKEAAAQIKPGRSGRRTHISTLVRWIKLGVKSSTGETVKLEAVRLGARWITSAEAIERFSERLTPDLEISRRPAPRSPRARRRASERAARQTDNARI